MIIDGKQIASRIQDELIQKSLQIQKSPSLHIIYAGTDPVIDTFIRFKERFGATLGVQVIVHRFHEDIQEKEIIEQIHSIASIASGIIVQLPLPPHMNTQSIVSAVPAECDIDVLGAPARELFLQGMTPLFPPVTGALVHIMKHYHIDIRNKKIVLVGYGQLVGYPTSLWLKKEGYHYAIIDGTTDDMTKQELLADADVIISGVGQPGIIQAEMIKEGAILFDAGTSESHKKITGDIDPRCYSKAKFVTPVPGGIGPLTIAVLYENLFKAHAIRYDLLSSST